jgi:hypothetical protein
VTVRIGPRPPFRRGLWRDNATVVPISLERLGSEPMDLLEPLDVAMMTAELLSRSASAVDRDLEGSADLTHPGIGKSAKSSD